SRGSHGLRAFSTHSARLGSEIASPAEMTVNDASTKLSESLRSPLVPIKPSSFCRHLPHLVGRMETRPEMLVGLQLLQHLGHADRIGPAQDSPAESGETDAQNQAHVHIARIPHNAFA